MQLYVDENFLFYIVYYMNKINEHKVIGGSSLKLDETWLTIFIFIIGGFSVKYSEMRSTKVLRVGSFSEGEISSFW